MKGNGEKRKMKRGEEGKGNEGRRNEERKIRG